MRVYIHCGLHKTGTTAVQQFLQSVAQPLTQIGILVPKSGRLDHFGGGHHNIAWFLTQDRRYDPQWGTLNGLLDEIAAHHGDAVLSSEDFETCLGAPHLFAPLTQDSRLRGRRFVFIVYLRDQIAYAEGLYSQNLGHGAGETCAAAMREIVGRRCLSMWEWRYQFDYWQIAQRMRAFSEGEVVFRSYDALAGQSIVPDFFRLIAPQTVLRGEMLPRSNPRWQMPDALAMFMVNRRERKSVSNPERAAIRLACNLADTAHAPLGSGVRQAMAKTFDAGNAALCRDAGLPPETLDLSRRETPPAGTRCFLDCVFSFDTQVSLAALAAQFADDVKLPAPDLDQVHPKARQILETMLAQWRSDRPEL